MRMLIPRWLAALVTCGAVLIGCCGSALAATGSASWPAAASRGIQELMGSGDGSPVSWDSATGLWGGKTAPYWWQSGLAVLTLARYAVRTHNVSPTVQRVLLRTYGQNVRRPGTSQPQNFGNRFMDDTGWWGLAWLAASQYELTYRHDQVDAAKFLSVAEWDASYIARQPRPCGGVEWGVGYGPDTISNAELLVLTAELAQYRQAAGPFQDGGRASRWLAEANRTWGWLRTSGLVDLRSGEVVADSMSPQSCQRRGGAVTYTQGEVAQALVQLGLAAHDPSYYDRAAAFLRYAVQPASGFVSRGVLQDHCEAQSPNCSALSTRLDVTAFKGLLVQAFDDWSRVTKRSDFSRFLRAQATAITGHDIWGATPRAPGCGSPHACQFGFSWARVLSPMLVTVGTQESALDALTAVLP
ncbi:MAG TPA: glycoside hydrolase family 76 protein [Solirubrobacteraceae bacterium]|nr:glycoside hydrolase family 76 protein [Solirubrobacteraceae bacterium]